MLCHKHTNIVRRSSCTSDLHCCLNSIADAEGSITPMSTHILFRTLTMRVAQAVLRFARNGVQPSSNTPAGQRFARVNGNTKREHCCTGSRHMREADRVPAAVQTSKDSADRASAACIPHKRASSTRNSMHGGGTTCAGEAAWQMACVRRLPAPPQAHECGKKVAQTPSR